MGLGYSWSNSTTGVGAKRRDTGDELRCLSSNPKTSLGLVGVSLAILDEAASLEVTAGEALWDSISTALGKPGSAMHVLLIGTRAPARSGWWLDLLDSGSHDGTYVQELKGNLDRWDDWREIQRVNPLTAISHTFRKKLLQERDGARRDERKKARFLSYRLNLETQDSTTMLLSVPSGRVDGFALTSGIPDVAAQEKRDVAARGTYTRLVDEGSLLVDAGRHIPRVSVLVEEILRRWPSARTLICDRFRLSDLLDAANGKGLYITSTSDEVERGQRGHTRLP